LLSKRVITKTVKHRQNTG